MLSGGRASRRAAARGMRDSCDLRIVPRGRRCVSESAVRADCGGSTGASPSQDSRAEITATRKPKPPRGERGGFSKQLGLNFGPGIIGLTLGISTTAAQNATLFVLQHAAAVGAMLLGNVPSAAAAIAFLASGIDKPVGKDLGDRIRN